MSENVQGKRGLVVRGLIAAAIVLLAVIYFLPVWWVSLTAPQYPPEAFPDGVRINFHMNGVFSGCELIGKAEIEEEEALDCVHEMDAINHFVGMYPIASGGVLEKAFAPFLLSMLGIMLIGFAIFNAKIRMMAMSAGFFVIAVWMYVTFFTGGGLKYQSNGYLASMVTSLGQGHEEEGEEISPIIAKLKAEMEKSGESGISTREEVTAALEKSGQKKLQAAIEKLHKGSGADVVDSEARGLKQILAEAKESGEAGKLLNIHILKGSYAADQAREGKTKWPEWNASNWQVVFWHYEKALGRWFNNPDEIGPLVNIMRSAGYLLFAGILLGMGAMVFAGRNNGILHWLLIVIPILLPVFFIIEYASWLWWYGHSMNEMGAFSLKAFMPTVFGQGKVAQFATHSYPSIGFGLMMIMSILLALAALIRRKLLSQEAAGAA